MKDGPEQDAQSGWQVEHELELEEGEEKVPCGQEGTHLPVEASWPLAQVRQKVDEEAQVVQEGSQAKEWQYVRMKLTR